MDDSLARPGFPAPQLSAFAEGERCGLYRWSHPQDHNLGGFDQRGRRLPRLQPHFSGRPRRYYGYDLLIPDRESNLCHQAADSDVVNASHQLIASAYAAHGLSAPGSRFCTGAKQQPIDFDLRDAVMTPGSLNAPNLPGIDPLLYRGEANPKLQRRLTQLQHLFVRMRRLFAHFRTEWYREPISGSKSLKTERNGIAPPLHAYPSSGTSNGARQVFLKDKLAV